MLELEICQALLGAIFSHVEGDVSLLSDDEHVHGPIETAQQVVDRLTYAMDPSDLSLETSTGDIAGFCMHFAKREDAKPDVEKLGPTFIVEGDNGSVHLVYLVEAPASQIEQIVSELNLDETESFYVDTAMPLPQPGYALSADDEAALGQGAEFPIYTAEEIFKFLFVWEDDPQDDDTPPWEDEKVSRLSADTVTKWNDADVYGTIPDDVLNLPIRISTGANQEEKIWRTTPEFAFRDLIETQLSKHVVGKKNGLCFVTGSLAEKKRTKNSVLGLYLLGVDVDSGASLEETFEKVRDLGICAVFYTTNSHLATELRIKQDRFYKFCAEEQIEAEADTPTVQRFLIKEGKYVEDVIMSAEYVETIHDGTGMHLVVHTRPIDKFRIIFPLKTPYIIAEQKMAQRDAVSRWEGMVMGMGALLNISIDRAARDPSRLFFLPRHQKDRPFRIMINGGKALDWTQIKGVSSKDKISSDPFDMAAAIMGGRMRGRAMSPTKGIDLQGWASEHAHGFEIAKVFNDFCSDRLRGETAPGKFTCECPFDDEHSNSGDPEDKGCFVQDAGVYAESFSFHCSHDSCAGRDRLQLLEKAMMDGWFSDDVLTDRAYNCAMEDEEEAEEKKDEEAEEELSKAETYTKALDLASKCTQGDVGKLREVLRLCVDLGYMERTQVINNLASKTKLTTAQINTMLKQIEASVTKDRPVEDEAYDAAKVSHDAKRRYSTLKRSKKPVCAIDEGQQAPTVNHVVQTLSELNRGRPAKRLETREGVEIIPAVEGQHFIYRYADTKCRIVPQVDGTFRPEPLNEKNIANLAKDYIEVIRVTDPTTYESIILPEWVCKQVVADPALDVLPLEGFASMPYYTRDRRLVTEIGYNEYAKKILRMQEDVANLLCDKSRGLIKVKPTMDDVQEALSEFFDYTFADFPFYDGEDIPEGRSSKAHLLAMMLHPLVRDQIDGPTPLYLVDKPSAGTGASLMVSSAMHIALGEPIGTSAMSENEDELRKQISSQFSAGKSVIFWDNVNVKLSSGFFANLATASKWEDRLLGQSEMISVKNTIQGIFAGNNVEASEENMRRMLLIRLDFKDDPTSADRTFKINNLEAYIKENKTDLFARLLTFVNYWISQGAPIFEGKPLTGFENYCQIIGGILQTCGVEGFLENRSLVAGSNNPDKLAWNGFIQEMISKIGFNKFVPMGDIVGTYCQMDNQPVLYVNGGGKVVPSEDESRTYAPMQRVIEKQLNQVFRVYVKGEETKVTIKKTVDREKSTSVYGVVMVEDKKNAA